MYKVWRFCGRGSGLRRKLKLDVRDWAGGHQRFYVVKYPAHQGHVLLHCVQGAQDRLRRFWCRPRRTPRAGPRQRQRKHIRPQGSTGWATMPPRANLDRQVTPRGLCGRSPPTCSGSIACSADIDVLRLGGGNCKVCILATVAGMGAEKTNEAPLVPGH
jgi:hypothetical protein